MRKAAAALDGRPLKPTLIAQLKEKAAEIKAKAGGDAGGETNTATQTEVNKKKAALAPSDDDSDVGESDHCELAMDVCF